MKALLLITSLIFTIAATAQTSEPTLKSTMGQMASALKAISAQSQDATKNANSAELTDKFLQLVQKARELIPSTANDKASQEQYIAMIDQVIAHAKELKSAFLNNENTKAIAILNTLVQDKKDGHAQFRN